MNFMKINHILGCLPEVTYGADIKTLGDIFEFLMEGGALFFQRVPYPKSGLAERNTDKQVTNKNPP